MFHFSWMKFKWDSQKNDLNKLKHHKKKDLAIRKVLQTVDKALLLQGFAIVGAAFLI